MVVNRTWFQRAWVNIETGSVAYNPYTPYVSDGTGGPLTINASYRMDENQMPWSGRESTPASELYILMKNSMSSLFITPAHPLWLGAAVPVGGIRPEPGYANGDGGWFDTKLPTRQIVVDNALWGPENWDPDTFLRVAEYTYSSVGTLSMVALTLDGRATPINTSAASSWFPNQNVRNYTNSPLDVLRTLLTSFETSGYPEFRAVTLDWPGAESTARPFPFLSGAVSDLMRQFAAAFSVFVGVGGYAQIPSTLTTRQTKFFPEVAAVRRLSPVNLLNAVYGDVTVAEPEPATMINVQLYETTTARSRPVPSPHTPSSIFWMADTVYSVRSNEFVETTVTIDGTLPSNPNLSYVVLPGSREQWQPAAGVDNLLFNASDPWWVRTKHSAYCVYDSDGYNALGRWHANGGGVYWRPGDDPSEVVLRFNGPVEPEDQAQDYYFSEGSDRPALYLGLQRHNGDSNTYDLVLWDQSTISASALPSANNRALAANIEIDNRLIVSMSQAIEAIVHTSAGQLSPHMSMSVAFSTAVSPLPNADAGGGHPPVTPFAMQFTTFRHSGAMWRFNTLDYTPNTGVWSGEAVDYTVCGDVDDEYRGLTVAQFESAWAKSLPNLTSTDRTCEAFALAPLPVGDKVADTWRTS